MNKFNPTLYLITNSDGMEESGFLKTIEEAIKGGVTLVQLREKEKTTKEYIALAKKVHKITSEYNIPLIIDDRIDVAIASECEGVHLGRDDMDIKCAREKFNFKGIMGATAKTVEQALKAQSEGADYLGVGAIYPTTTKVKTILTSTETLCNITKNVSIPVCAIGGLNKSNLGILRKIDISGICVVSAIMKSENPKKEAEMLMDEFNKLKKEGI